MRNADATIERLLGGLRDAEPSAGIERRILQAMEDAIEAREAAAADLPWRRPLHSWLRRPAMAKSLACAVVLTAFLVATKVHQPGPVAPNGSSHSTRADARQSTPLEAVAQKAPIAPSRTHSQFSFRPERATAVAATGEPQATSYPAPPLPLTGQEKLLLRLAHREDAQDMDLLNPDLRAAQSAQAAEQFQQFFEIDATERNESE